MILYVDKDKDVLDVERTQSSSTLPKYKQIITKNGTQTEFTINHNLNTEDVIVQINNGEVPIFIYWKVIDKNNVKLSFNEPPDDGVIYNVTIFGTGNNSSNGGEYSSEDIQELRDDIDELRQSFQDGVDTIYNKCVSEGSTPTENSPSAISDAIGILRSEGTATASDILSGKTAISNKKKITGIMENKGQWNSSDLIAGSSVTIPKGYHNGSGKVTAKSLSSQTSATAESSDILYGKTAYVNGNKITGNMENKGSYIDTYFNKIMHDGSIGNYDKKTIPKGYHNGSGNISPDIGVVFMPYLIAGSTNANSSIRFIYLDALNTHVYAQISSGVVNTNYAPYLFVAYNFTNKTICDYAIQIYQTSNSMTEGIYRNISFRIDSANRLIYCHSLNQNYGNGNYEIHVRIYSLSYNISFNNT